MIRITRPAAAENFMTKTSPSERFSTSERSKREILGTAAEVFSDLGYDGASIDIISRQLGSTKGRIYHHYSSKAELFLDVQQTAMARMLDTIRPISQLQIAPSQKLGRMAFSHARLIMEDNASQCVAVQGLTRHLVELLSKRHAQQVSLVMAARDSFEGLYVGVIDEGVAQGVFRAISGRFAAKPVLGALNWITLWYRSRKLQTDRDLDELARIHSEFALRSLRPDSAVAWQAA